jgi:ubiquinone/menaquinone biosynthesis C-methylase UbiE
MRSFGVITARLYSLFSRNTAPNRMVVEMAGLDSADRALEVGCGPGTAVKLAAERIGAERVAAVDPSPTFVEMVRKRVPGADIRVSGAEELPFEDHTFTVIWSIASMHHWTDRTAGLASLTAKLASGGRLLLAERLLRKPGHGITPEQADDVMAALSGLGLTDVRRTERANGRTTMLVIEASSS